MKKERIQHYVVKYNDDRVCLCNSAIGLNLFNLALKEEEVTCKNCLKRLNKKGGFV